MWEHFIFEKWSIPELSFDWKGRKRGASWDLANTREIIWLGEYCIENTSFISLKKKFVATVLLDINFMDQFIGSVLTDSRQNLGTPF